MMIEPDFSELVDEDRGIGKRARGEQLPQQRGLAAPEKAGDYINRDVCCLCRHDLSNTPCTPPACSIRSISAGSSGSQGRPNKRSAASHTWLRLSTISVRPVRVLSRYLAPSQSVRTRLNSFS